MLLCLLVLDTRDTLIYWLWGWKVTQGFNSMNTSRFNTANFRILENDEEVQFEVELGLISLNLYHPWVRKLTSISTNKRDRSLFKPIGWLQIFGNTWLVEYVNAGECTLILAGLLKDPNKSLSKCDFSRGALKKLNDVVIAWWCWDYDLIDDSVLMRVLKTPQKIEAKWVKASGELTPDGEDFGTDISGIALRIRVTIELS